MGGEDEGWERKVGVEGESRVVTFPLKEMVERETSRIGKASFSFWILIHKIFDSCK